MIVARSTIRTLHELSAPELDRADPRYPKWATMCRHRFLRLPVLNAVLITPGERGVHIAAAIEAIAEATGQQRLMLRSDGGTETRRYYRGGNSFPLDELQVKVPALLSQGRAVILLEPTNRYTNRMTVLLRMDRPAVGQAGQFTIEALGPGYDVADLTRGGVSPQVTITAANVNWSCYRQPWWSDLRLSQNQSPAAEQARKRQHLQRLATYVLTDTGHLNSQLMPADPAAAAEAWLRHHGYLELWHSQDIAALISSRAREWFDDAFLIAKCHRNRSWTCLATATSNLGSGRWVFWDVVDGSRKYGTISGRTA
jgi:hypothetical protein